MTQLDLFTNHELVTKPVAKARHTDPATSHEAASKVERSGKANSDRQRILDYVTAHPDVTGGEIAKGLNWSIAGFVNNTRVMKRVPELVKRNKLERVGERDCSVMKTKQGFYRAK